MRTEELMRPGFHHDVCSTVQPMAAAAPFFREWDPESRGVRLVHPEINFAHPLDGGGAALSFRSLEETAARLGADGAAYRRLFEPLVAHGTDVIDFFLTRSCAGRRPAACRRSSTSGSTGCPTCGGWRTGTSTPRRPARWSAARRRTACSTSASR